MTKALTEVWFALYEREICRCRYCLLQCHKGRHRFGLFCTRKKNVAIDFVCPSDKKADVDLVWFVQEGKSYV